MSEIVMLGKPIPKMAVKNRVVKGRVFKYSPQSRVIKEVTEYLKSLPIKKLSGAVRFTATYYMPIPKSTSKKKRAEMIGAPHTKRPDVTNLNKFYEDCLNEIGYDDDGQIATSITKKIYDENPRTEIILEEI